MPTEAKIGADTKPKRPAPNDGKGRPPGAVNKTTKALKEAILLAAEEAGGPDGLVGYLRRQAEQEPASFMSLLGKVLPLTLAGDASSPLTVEIIRFGNDSTTG